MYRLLISALIGISFCLPACAKSITADGKIEFAIASVDRRPNPPKGLANGLLLLSLKNRTKEPLSLVLRLPQCRELFDIGPTNSRTSTPEESKVNTDFAFVSYTWKMGSRVVDSGIVDLAVEAIEIERQCPLYVPIRIPERPGRYTLSVDFDNRRLIKIREFASHSSDYGVFFGAHDEHVVNVLSK